MPLITDEGRAVVEHRHREYGEWEVRWRWLYDSLEGGQQYRDAEYGQEPYTVTWPIRHPGDERIYTGRYVRQIPIHNLIRHPQEYPVPPGMGGMGEWTADAPETGDDYEYRRQLTPVPDFVQEAVSIHLARIYGREVRRDAPPGPLGDKLRAWWLDVDGSGQSIDDWMHETIAPLFLALGQLDFAFDHPAAPRGVRVASRADEARLRLDRCIGSYILPGNVLDWKLRPDREYEWVVIREYIDDAEVFRKWTATGWTLYDADGERKDSGTHPYGCVPIFRAFDRRIQRCDNVGLSRYQRIAEIQRAYYNADSELTLTNSYAAHALLSGPEDAITGQGITVGPGYVLPKKKTSTGDYVGWEYVSAPIDAADRIRQKLMDFRDEADRAACLLKPAGQTGGATVSQSGISKQMDMVTGNDLLKSLVKSLQQVERWIAHGALDVLNNGPVPPEYVDKVKRMIVYPSEFDLFTAEDLFASLESLQSTAALSGALPITESEYMVRAAIARLPGLPDKTQVAIRAEIEGLVGRNAALRALPAPEPEPTPPAVPDQTQAQEPGALAA
jgi:hypothetical protein